MDELTVSSFPSSQNLKPMYRVSNYVVCVLDLLGQKEKLKTWSVLPEDGQLTPTFRDGLQQTVGTLIFLNETFTKFFEKRWSGISHDNLALELMPNGERERYLRQKNFQLGVAQFSDTFVFYAPLVGDVEHELMVLPVYAVLGACCMTLLLSLAAGCPVRGGIDIGPGIKIPELSFYGPALANAHHLENEVAEYPRIVVSPSVAKFVQHTPAPAGQSLVGDWKKDMLGICCRMLCQDYDDQVIVDWLGSCWQHIVGWPNIDPQISQALRKAYDFVGLTAENFKNCLNANPDEANRAKMLAERYSHLYAYMVNRLPAWDINISSRPFGVA